MYTVLFLIIALAAVLVFCGEVFGADNERNTVSTCPMKTKFTKHWAQLLYYVCWAILVIALCADIIFILSTVFSGLQWLWLILILPAAVILLPILATLIAMIIVALVVIIFASCCRWDF